MVRGMAADASAHRPLVRVGLATAIVLLVPVIVSAPWSVADFVAAGVFLAAIGVVIELAVKRVGNLTLALGIAVVGVLAGVAGEADDAPGLVLLGLVLIVSACALGLRAWTRPAQHGR